MKARSEARLARDLLSAVIAGFLWLLATIPMVTIVPATAGLFAVTARPGSRPSAVWSTFWISFLRHLRQGVALGALVALVMAVLMVNVTLAVQQGGVVATVMILVASLAALMVSGTLVFLFPLIVAYPASWKQSLRDAVLLAGGFPLIAIGCLAVLGVAAVVVAILPPLLPLNAGVAALTVSKVAQRVFDKVIERQAAERHTTTSPKSNY